VLRDEVVAERKIVDLRNVGQGSQLSAQRSLWRPATPRYNRKAIVGRCTASVIASRVAEVVLLPLSNGWRVFRLHQTGIVNAPSSHLILGFLPVHQPKLPLFAFTIGPATVRYWSNQTSSSRKLLMMLLTIIVQFFTRGCQQYAKRL
jgi:hypothetical protein